MTNTDRKFHDRSAWKRGEGGPQTIAGKNYKNLVEFSRPCKACGEPFSIFVTPKIAAGHADSNSFALKNCEKHRRGLRNANTAQLTELEQLRLTVRNLRDECNSHISYIQELKAELMLYKPPTAREAIASVQKMPWQ